MRWIGGGTLLLLLAAGVAGAEDTPLSAANITTRGRSLEAILESALYPDRDPTRTVMLVIDPSRALRTARLGTALRKVMLAHGKKRGKNLRLGVAVIGAKKGEKPLPPGSEPRDVRRRVNDALMNPRNVLRDVYTPLRDLAPLFARERGVRTIVLFAHQNGDAEYRLEKVIAALKKSRIRVVVVTREVLLSDAYWYGRARSSKFEPPKRAYLGGSDGAFVEIPWGWAHQGRTLTSSAGSGFATWGLSRLAAATGGRVEILYTTELTTHLCGGSWFCAFCTGHQHEPANQSLLAVRMKAIEPSLAPRRTVLGRAGSDPYYKAVLRAWKAAHKADLLAEPPSMRRGGGGLVQNWDRERSDAFIFMERMGAWKREAYDAKLRARDANRIATSLRKAIAAGDKSGGSDRYRSVAELTYVMLRLTRLNYLYLQAFCRDVAPRITPPKARTPEAPEVPLRRFSDDLTGYYLVVDRFSLCHGVEPFFQMKHPGGNGLDVELRAFALDYKSFLRRNAHTPFTVALSHMGIARFRLAGIGKGNVKGSTGAARQSPTARSKKKDTRTVEEREPERGERGGGSSGGGSGSPTSGG